MNNRDPNFVDEIQTEGREVATTESMVGLIAAAEIDQQIATAHKYPRSLVAFRKEALQMVTLTETIAQECVYALKRGDKTIQGPSARFAEIIFNAWGNARAGARVVHTDDQFVTSQGVCQDLQKNTAITFEVQRRITDSKGKRYNADMIGVTSNAASSIALRNAILKVVPKAFWSELYTAALKVGVGDVTTLANKRLSAITAFQHYGVTEAQILAKLGRSGVQDVSLDDLTVLFGILTAIKDNETTPEEAFSEEGGATTRTASVPGPRAKSADAPVDHQPAAASENDPAVPTDKPAQDEKKPEDDGPMSAGPLKILRAQMLRAALTDADLIAKFGPVESLKGSQFEPIKAWIAERAKKNAG